METREYKSIFKDLRHFSSENEQLSPDAKAKLNGYIDELELKRKNTGFVLLLLCIFIVFCSIMWISSGMENENLKYDNRNKQNIIESYEQIIRFEDDSTHSFVYKTRNGKTITYQELMEENYELLEKNSALQYANDVNTLSLNLIKVHYGIVVKERNHNLYVEGERVDSALMLLNVYRNKIRYNPEKKVWSVER